MSYTPVISGRIAIVSGQNVSGPRAAQTAGGLADCEGVDVTNDTQPDADSEVRLRLAAITSWAEYGMHGRCTLAAALDAITVLAAAAEGFLSEPEAA